jgi:hypothetical protein
MQAAALHCFSGRRGLAAQRLAPRDWARPMTHRRVLVDRRLLLFIGVDGDAPT